MDIKIGEFVRTAKGKFYKIKTINRYGIVIKYENKEDEISSDINYYTESGLEINKKDITKHSFNLIDLIEVGDYVNGYKVISVDKNAPENCIECIELDRNNAYEYQFISSKDIQSILTHEQFEANCYKTKGE